MPVWIEGGRLRKPQLSHGGFHSDELLASPIEAAIEIPQVHT